MELTVCRLSLILAALLCAVPAWARPPDRDLLSEFDVATQTCPINTIDNFYTQACQQRRHAATLLGQRGWCYGHLDPDFEEKVWRPCDQN